MSNQLGRSRTTFRMTPKLGQLFFLETGTALQRKTLHILENIHTGVNVFQVSIKDKIISIKKSIRKRESRIQELIKGQDLTKKDEGDRKQALKTCVNKRENEKKNFPKDGFEHHDQELELNIRTKYRNKTEKDVPDENSTLSGKGVSLNQTYQNVCAARDDEHQAISKKVNTLLSEHLQKEEQSFESRLNEDISSSVDQNNDCILDVGGCEIKEDQDSTVQQTNSLTNVEQPPTQATGTVQQAVSKIEIGREDGGCDHKEDQGSTLPQTNLLTNVEQPATQATKTVEQGISKIEIGREDGGCDHKEDQGSTLPQTNLLTNVEPPATPATETVEQGISKIEIGREDGDCDHKEDQGSTLPQTNLLTNVEPPATPATETVEQAISKIEIGQEGGCCDHKEDLGSTVLQTNFLTYVEHIAALEKKTYDQQTVSKGEKTSLSKLIQRYEQLFKEMLLLQQKFDSFLDPTPLSEDLQKELKSFESRINEYIASYVDQNNGCILDVGGCENKEDQDSTVQQTNSLTNVEQPATQATGTVEQQPVSKIAITPFFQQLQKDEPSRESYFDEVISSPVNQNNYSFHESGGCDHKLDQDSTVLQTISPRYVVPLATQAVETDRRTFQCRLKPLKTIRQEYHQNCNVNAFNAQSGRRFKRSNNSINDFGQSAKSAETSSKENCVDYKEYMPRRVFMSVKRKKIKCLGKKSERRAVLLECPSDLAADKPQLESILNHLNIAGIINEKLPNDGERLAQDSEIDEDEELFYILEQDEEKTTIQNKDKKEPVYRLNVVTAEVFENAMRQYQIENYEITHTNYFPSNCRMFLHIPVLKGGFINRRDMKNRR